MPVEVEEDRDQKQTERQKVIGEMRKKSYALSKNSAYLDTKKVFLISKIYISQWMLNMLDL